MSSILSQSAGAVVEVRSTSLRQAWTVPADLIALPSASIVMLTTRTAVPEGDVAVGQWQTLQLPPPSTRLCAVAADDAALVNDLPASTVPAAPATAAECSSSSSSSQSELIEREHDTIVRLAISHSVVKYWLYLRMFWHCRGVGSGDLLVRSKIALIESIADKGRGVPQRWTRVKKGLALMALLLNNRHTLAALLDCRTSELFDKLIYLQVRHQQEPMIAHLVQRIRSEGASNVTALWMSKVCQSRERESGSTPPSQLEAGGEPDHHTDEDDARDDDSDGEAEEQDAGQEEQSEHVEEQPQQADASVSVPKPHGTRTRAAPRRPTVSPPPAVVKQTVKRRLALQTSPRMTTVTVKRVRQNTTSAQKNERIAETPSDRRAGRRMSSPSAPASSSLVPSSPTTSPSTSPTIPETPAEQLRVALLEMQSMPVLAYYSMLLKEFSEQVHVAAPFSYTEGAMYDEMMHHRLEDQCHAQVLLYERDFLLHHSNGLTVLPALALSRCPGHSTDAEPALSCMSSTRANVTEQAVKVWLFLSDVLADDSESGDNSNSRKAFSVYEGFNTELALALSSLSEAERPWDRQDGQLPILPARLLLEAGVHVLLAVQRAGETISMPGSSPSRYDSPCAHMVHTLPSRAVLSVGGNYCSSQHLLDHIEYQWAQLDGRKTSQCEDAMPTDVVPVEYPPGVFHAAFPLPTPLRKPTVSWLGLTHRAMTEDHSRTQQARASELSCPDQMLYLFNRQLDWTISQRSTAPPPGVVNSLTQLVCEAPTAEDRTRLITLLTKAIAMSTIAGPLHRYRPCCLAFGCPAELIPVLPRLSDAVDVPVFHFSAKVHRRPLLFVRVTDDESWTRQQVVAQSQLSAWQQRKELYGYSVTRPAMQSAAAADTPTFQTSVERPQAIAAHHLHPVYSSHLHDICAGSASVRQRTVAELKRCVNAELVDGGALRWCELPTDGVHRPSFHLLRSSSVALSTNLVTAAHTGMHNQPQRLGFWHHILPADSPAVIRLLQPESEPLVLGRDVLDDVNRQEQVRDMYKMFAEMTKLSGAADTWTKSDANALSAFVSVSFGELAQASMTRVLECMVEHTLRSDDVFFDVGSCYGRALCHVRAVTGIRSCGVEAVAARHIKATECLAAWDERFIHRPILGRGGGMLGCPPSASVELWQGDIMDHLPLTLAATHVMVFEARFQPAAREILQYVWASLARQRLRMLLCTTKLPTALGDNSFVLVAELNVTTGPNAFTMYAYQARSTDAHSPLDPVQVAVFAGQRFGLCASRNVRSGERLLAVIGNEVAPGTWRKLRKEASQQHWQWMVRRNGRWLHVLNLARFVNSGCRADKPAEWSRTNADYVLDSNGSWYLQSTRAISRGEEIVACGGQHTDIVDAGNGSDILPWSCYKRIASRAIISHEAADE